MPTISQTTLASYNGLVASTQTDYTGNSVVIFDALMHIDTGYVNPQDFLVENSSNNIKFILFQIGGEGTLDSFVLANSGSTTVLDLKALVGGTIKCGQTYQYIPNNNSGTTDIGHIRARLATGTSGARRVRVTVLLND
tara:strand:+ start:58 stop:471 length:414 start_codon:yes stop_codon:yes gene_type:complete